MPLFENFPYTNFHDLNLDQIVKAIKNLDGKVEEYLTYSTITYADPIQWNITRQYAATTVVIDPATGIAYISTKPVPDNILITNTGYWTPIFDLSSLFDNINDQITALTTAIDTVNNNLSTETTERTAADTAIENSITEINEKISSLHQVTVQDFGAVADGVTDDLQAFIDAINSGKEFIVPEGNYYLSDYIFTTSEHCISDKGTYINKPFIVTKFSLSMAGLAEVPFTNKTTQFNGSPYTGICVDSRRNRIIVGAGNSGGLIAFDLSTGAFITRVTMSEVGHANDLAYDPEDDLIYCASYSETNQTSVTVIYASNLSLKEMKNVGYPVHTCSYDKENKLFYLSDYYLGHVYDHNWNQIRTFNIGVPASFLSENYLPSDSIGVDGQGTFIKDGTLYYMLWIRNAATDTHLGNFYTYGNAIVCFNGENLTSGDIYTIPNANAFDELEGFEYYNGKLIGVTNNNGRSGKLTYWAAEKAKTATMPFMPVEYLGIEDIVYPVGNAYYTIPEASAFKIGQLIVMQMKIACGSSITHDWTQVCTMYEYCKPVSNFIGNTRAIGMDVGSEYLNPVAGSSAHTIVSTDSVFMPLSMDAFGNVSVKGGIPGKIFLVNLIYPTNA